MALTREQVRRLREALQPKLDALTEELGFQLRLGNASFLDVVTFKLECSPVGVDGTVETKEAGDFRRLAPLYGMTAADLGREFTFQGKTFQVSGMASRSQRYPVLATSEGKVYKFAVEAIRRLLPVQTAEDPA